METKEYIYNGRIVEFLFHEDLMVNATEMAAVFGQKTNDFLRLESTKKWIAWLEKSAIRANRSGNSTTRLAGNTTLPGEIKHRSADLVPILVVERGGDGGGMTWMHHMLAIDFAMWLDVSFKGWVILKVRDLINGYAMEKRGIIMAKKELEAELEKIESEEAERNPQVKRVFELLKSKRQLQGDEFNLNKNFIKSLFDETE